MGLSTFLSLSALQASVVLLSAGVDAIPRGISLREQSNSSVVTWDDHSLMINGERLMVYSAEVHGFRYPGYNSWVEVFQKLKAAGFNTVSTYFFWGMVESKRGQFNWDGYRDPQAFFDAAAEAGLYVISRPGPYINAEVSSGGFPGWLQRVEGPARNSGQAYTEAYMPYIEEVFKITAQNQIDRGGPVIALQLENEYDEAVGGEDFEYERILAQAAVDAGITVPTTHNGAMAPAFKNFFIDHVDIWGYDEYPATKTVCPGPDTWPADAIKQYQWEQHLQPDFNRGQPMAIYEFEGGFKQTWGDAGYCSELASVDFQKMFFKNKYAMATTIFNIYMAWGGTNWGNLASPDCYTSYDFGGLISEERQLRTKYYEAKVQAQFLQSSPAFLTAFPQNIGTNEGAFVASSDKNLTVTLSLDMEGKKTKFLFTRHTDASYKLESEYTLVLPTSQGNISVPQLGGKLSLRGRDTKIHVTDYVVGKHTLLYSTAEVFTSLVIDGVTTVFLYGDRGQLHETAFIGAGRKPVSVFGGGAVKHEKKGDSLVLSYHTSDKTVVKVGNDLAIYLLDRETAYLTWPDAKNQVLVLGGHLIRKVSVDRGTLQISGDLNETTVFEFVAPKKANKATFNGRKVELRTTKYGTRVATVKPLLPEVSLPDLKALKWRKADSLPELSHKYDDSKWTTADLKKTNNPNTPETPVSLYGGDYGFHTGIILWRGHFNAVGGEEELSLDVFGGVGFGYSVYDNGVLLNSWTGRRSNTNSRSKFALAAPWKAGEEHVITVVQDHMGYRMSWTANTALFKEPRGIFGYNLTSSDGSLVTHSDVVWKVQGNLGGEDYVDQTRGPFNEGGLYGERHGWHLPDFPDKKWDVSGPLDGISKSGVAFYRTTFDLKIPDSVDYPISLQLPTIASNSSPYRAVIYVNGYQFGRYASTLGPQTRFPIPPEVLNRKGKNTLAIALWAMGKDGAALSSLTLQVDAKLEYGGPKLGQEPAPSFKAKDRSHAS